MSAVERGIAIERVYSEMQSQGMTPRLGPSRGSRNLRAAVLNPPALREWDDTENLARYGTNVLQQLSSRVKQADLEATFGSELATLAANHERLNDEQRAQFGKSIRRHFGDEGYEQFLSDSVRATSTDPVQTERVGFFREALTGFMGGLDNTRASIHGLQAKNEGDVGDRQEHLDKANELLTRAASRPGDAPMFTDIDSVRDAAKWVTRTTAEQIPNLGAMYGGFRLGAAAGAVAGGPAGALVGGLIGTFAATSMLYKGSIYNASRSGGAEHEAAADSADFYGNAAGAVSMIVPSAIMGAASGHFGRAFIHNKVKDTLKTAAGAIPAEGTAEAVAEAFVIAGEEEAMGQRMHPDQKRERLINAAAAGAAMGGLMAPISGVNRRADVDTMIDELIDGAETSDVDRDDLAIILESTLRRTGKDASPEHQAVLDYLKQQGRADAEVDNAGEMNRNLDSASRKMGRVGRNVARRSPKENARRLEIITDALAANPDGLPEDLGYELTSILGQFPELRREWESGVRNASGQPDGDSTVVPESENQINAQLDAVQDPSSDKDTVFVPKGSQLPSVAQLPDNVHVIDSPEGRIITTDPEKATQMRKAVAFPADERDRFLGQMLYGIDTGKTESNGLVVRATNATGVPVAEIATSFDRLDSDAALAERQMPAGGRVEVTTALDAVSERQGQSVPIADEILAELGINQPAQTFEEVDLTDPRAVLALEDVLAQQWPDPIERADVIERLNDPNTSMRDHDRIAVMEGVRERMGQMEAVQSEPEIEVAEPVATHKIPVEPVEGATGFESDTIIESRQIPDNGKLLARGEDRSAQTFSPRSPETFLRDTMQSAANKGRMYSRMLMGRGKKDARLPDSEYDLISRSLMTLTHESGEQVTFHLPTLTSGGMDLMNAEGTGSWVSDSRYRLMSFTNVLGELAARGYHVPPNTVEILADSIIFSKRSHNKQRGAVQTLGEITNAEYAYAAEQTARSDDAQVRAAQAEAGRYHPNSPEGQRAYRETARVENRRERQKTFEQSEVEELTGQSVEENTLSGLHSEGDRLFDAQGNSLDANVSEAARQTETRTRPQPKVISGQTRSQTERQRQRTNTRTNQVYGYGESINRREVDFVRGVLDELGMHQIAMTVGDVESLDTMVAAGELSIGQMREAKRRFEDPAQLALFIPVEGTRGVIIARSPRRQGEDVDAQRLLRIGHEVGHAVYNGIRERIVNPQTDRDRALAERMQQAFEKDRNKDASYSANRGFEEWFADKIAARARNYVQAAPHGQVERYFARSARDLKKTYNAVKGRLHRRFHRNTTFEDLIDAYKEDNAFANARNILGDERMKSMRDESWAKDDPPNPRRTLRGKFREAVSNFVNGVDARKTPGLNYLFDVHNQIQAAGYTQTADAIYQETNTVNASAYWPQVDAAFSRFEGALNQIIPRGTGKEATQQIFNQLARELPDEQLTTKARQVRVLLREFHAYLSESVPNMGQIEDFFPRTYAVTEIEKRFTDFTGILQKHGMDEAEAKQVYEDLTVDDRAAVTDDNFIAGRTSHLNKHRRMLDKELVRDLVDAGFLNPDPYRTLQAYLRKSVRRAELERKFGGHKVLNGWKINATSEIDTRNNEQVLTSYLNNYGFEAYTEDGFNQSVEQAQEYGYLVFEERPGGVRVPMWRDPLKGLDDMITQEAVNIHLPNALKELGMTQAEASQAGLLDLQQMVYQKDGQWAPIVPEKAMAHIRKLVRHALDAEQPLDPNSAAYNIAGEIRAYQALRTLVFSGVASIPEFAALYARNKDTLSFREFSRLTADTIRNYNDARTLAEAMGVASRDINDVILQEMLADHNRGKYRFFRRMTPAMFHLNANHAIVQMTRTVGTSLGQVFLVRNAETMLDQNASDIERTRAKRYLAELGITDPQEVIDWKNDFVGGRPQLYRLGDTTRINMTRRKMQDAINIFVGEGVLQPNAAERPTYANHPVGGMFFHLKTFMYSYNKRIMGGLFREGASSSTEQTAAGVSRGTKYRQMASFYLPVVGLFLFFGAISDELRNRLRTLGQRGSWEANYRDPAAMGRKWVDRAGFTSLPYLGAVPIPGVQDVDTWDVTFAAGPVFSHGYELFFDDNGISRSDAMKMVPVLSQFTALRAALYNNNGGADNQEAQLADTVSQLQQLQDAIAASSG